MEGVLFTGGRGPDRIHLETALSRAAKIVAADSGLEYAISVGAEPDLVVGDMDSLSRRDLLERYPAERVKLYPPEKDETDTEIGLQALRDMGCRELTIAGGGGGRLDHLLGILCIFDRPDPPRHWYTGNHHIVCIEDRFVSDELNGRTVSFFPAGNRTCRMKSSGLKWPLDGHVWERGDCGISNVVTGPVLEVNVTSGRLLMVRQLREE